MNLTLDNLPNEIECALRAKASAEHKSLDQAAVDAIARGLGIKSRSTKKRDLSGIAGQQLIAPEMRAVFEEQQRIDLSDIAGTWESDPETEAILEEQNRIDPEMWK